MSNHRIFAIQVAYTTGFAALVLTINACSGSKFNGVIAPQVADAASGEEVVQALNGKSPSGEPLAVTKAPTAAPTSATKTENDTTGETLVSCRLDTGIAKAGQSIKVVFSDNVTTPTLTHSGGGAAGTIVASGNSKEFKYTAPASIPAVGETEQFVTIASGGASAVSCKVLLLPDGGLGVKDDGVAQALVGNVYQLPPNTPKLPDLGALTPVTTVAVPNLDVPTRDFRQGFPGVKTLVEWFAIRFKGRIKAPATGWYTFRLTSDDGAILRIAGQTIVDNDGLHSTQSKDGQVFMPTGEHEFQIDYYQGPGHQIALELRWHLPTDPDQTTFKIVPPESFLRPLK